jgi:hypothetical protein
MRFWMRRRSSGSVTSVQSSDLIDLDLDLDAPCFLLLWPLDSDWCLEDGLEGIVADLSMVAPESSTSPAGFR